MRKFCRVIAIVLYMPEERPGVLGFIYQLPLVGTQIRVKAGPSDRRRRVGAESEVEKAFDRNRFTIYVFQRFSCRPQSSELRHLVKFWKDRDSQVAGKR